MTTNRPVDLDHSGDAEYDRLTFRLEARLLATGADRTPEATAWLKYRVETRAAKPSQPDDLDRIAQRAADLRARQS